MIADDLRAMDRWPTRSFGSSCSSSRCGCRSRSSSTSSAATISRVGPRRPGSSSSSSSRSSGFWRTSSSGGTRCAPTRFRRAQSQEDFARQYIQGVAGTSPSVADEISKLVDLKNSGAITETEFERMKAHVIGRRPRFSSGSTAPSQRIRGTAVGHRSADAPRSHTPWGASTIPGRRDNGSPTAPRHPAGSAGWSGARGMKGRGRGRRRDPPGRTAERERDVRITRHLPAEFVHGTMMLVAQGRPDWVWRWGRR